jgi:hypothetical protein
MEHWTENAIEPFFVMLSDTERTANMINMDNVYCAESKIVPGEKGVYARKDIPKGSIVEWGVAEIIPGMDVRFNDMFYTWGADRRTAAALSGCAQYYNTLGDKSNVRCVPYHTENRFENYALEDILAGTELTIRYDSMNYREGMKHLLDIVGVLKHGDRM